MKDIVVVKRNDTVIFEGKLYDLPFKEEAVKEVSIKLFSDPEPCIIHQTYAMQSLVEPLIKLLRKGHVIKLTEVEGSFLNFSDISSLTMMKKGS